jgi:hypothetical protein
MEDDRQKGCTVESALRRGGTPVQGGPDHSTLETTLAGLQHIGIDVVYNQLEWIRRGLGARQHGQLHLCQPGEWTTHISERMTQAAKVSRESTTGAVAAADAEGATTAAAPGLLHESKYWLCSCMISSVMLSRMNSVETCTTDSVGYDMCLMDTDGKDGVL